MKFCMGAVGAALMWSLGWAGGVVDGQELVVSADGSAQFQTIQEALNSIPGNNAERKTIFIRRGVYREQLLVQAPFVALRGESRSGTRIEFAPSAAVLRAAPPGAAPAVVTINAPDCVLSSLTVANTASQELARAFAVRDNATRTVLMDCDFLSQGGETLALGARNGGCYYLARCAVRGAADCFAPHGWCYATDCAFYETGSMTLLWHDGHWKKGMKCVLHHCSFDGSKPWTLAAHQYDAQYFFLQCGFSASMRDLPPGQGAFPPLLTDGTPAPESRWGARAYFFQSHREAGDYAWNRDTPSNACPVPAPALMTAHWTFDYLWNPDCRRGPQVESITQQKQVYGLIFSEPVSVGGQPRLVLADKTVATYAGHRGPRMLLFRSAAARPPRPRMLELDGAVIQATAASAFLRLASPVLPGRMEGAR